MTKFKKEIRSKGSRESVLMFPCGAELRTTDSQRSIKWRLHRKICKICSVNCPKLKDCDKLCVTIDAATKELKDTVYGRTG